MKVSRYECGGEEGWAVGSSESGHWHGCTASSEHYPGALDALIAQGTEAFVQAAQTMLAAPVVELAGVRLLPPLGNPGKIICVGLNYIDHSAESGFEQPEYPTLFSRFTTTLIAHGEPLRYPTLSDTFDYEGELAVIIGKGGKSIERAEALAHVLGYSVFNDASVREYQFKSPQWMMGKNFDGTGAFGPWFVTADALPAGARGLRLETRLNGETVQSANTQDMVFDVESLIVTISEVMTLEAGDVIVAGTPAGIGHAREPRLYMRPGDLCEVEIEGIGLLSNRVESTPNEARSV